MKKLAAILPIPLFLVAIVYLLNLQFDSFFILTLFVIFFSLFLSFQSIFALLLMVYAWDNPEEVEKNRSPKEFNHPHYSFTALLPARHEEKVIEDTVSSIVSINYPDHLKEVLVICRMDDEETISATTRVINRIGKGYVKLVLFSGDPINKPHGLNVGLSEASGNIVVVFDAEDEPHPDIYNVVNTVMVKDNADVVQSGVQLMNYASSWFSVLNVLEYYFWYKSSLQFFARHGVIPLGGNTVFFKKEWIEKVGGWDETCLTEDADIGIRLSLKNANIRVVYDPVHATQEETPHSIGSFIKQRTRWDQGWVQVLLKGDWAHIKGFFPRVLALYILLWPEVQAVMFFYIPLSFLMILFVKLPVFVSLLSTLPLYLLIIQLIVYNIGFYEFTKEYKLEYPWWAPFMLFAVYYPYHVLLSFSAARALIRMILGNNSWEKTLHINAHRQAKAALVAS